MANFLYKKTPLDPHVFDRVDPRQDVTPLQYANEQGINNREVPVICSLNGEYIPRAEWDNYLKPTDIVLFTSLPRGGGGGGGMESNTNQIIATVLIIIVAIILIVLTWGAATPVVALILFAASTALTVANMLLATPPQGPEQKKAASVFSFSGNTNQARQDALIPDRYGQTTIIGDLVSLPWQEFDRNEQYTYILICLGEGQYHFDEEPKLNGTPFSDIVDVRGDPSIEWEQVEPYSNTTILGFKTLVWGSREVSGLELKEPSPIDPDVPPSPANPYTEWQIGPFVASPQGGKCGEISVSYMFPNGLFGSSLEGDDEPAQVLLIFEYAEIDDSGNLISDWNNFFSRTHQETTHTSLRYTETHQMPSHSRWTMRGKRTSIQGGAGGHYHICVKINGAASYRSVQL